MSLIFDRFRTEEDARRFIERVREVSPGRECQLFLDADEAQAHDPFPWVLDPPVVHVDRDEDGEDEEETIRSLAPEFHGVFAGT